jgi:hypothetical protein
MDELGSLLLTLDLKMKPVLEKAKTLTPFAVRIRYPGEDEILTWDKANEKCAIAKEIYDEVLKRMPKSMHPLEP